MCFIYCSQAVVVVVVVIVAQLSLSHVIVVSSLTQFPESGHPVCEEEGSEGRHCSEDYQRDQPLQW